MQFIDFFVLKDAVSRAESIHLLRGTARAKERSRTSVEVFPQTGKSPTRPVVMNTLFSGDGKRSI